jgi:hypothetical protein
MRKKNNSKKPKEQIIPLRNVECSVFVKPVYVRKGDFVTWKAVDSDITFFFPDSNLFGETIGTIQKGKHKSLKVQLGTRSRKGEPFYYSVYHHGLKDFGHGNSSPAIIIQR